MTKDASVPAIRRSRPRFGQPGVPGRLCLWAEGLLTLSSVSEWIEPGSSFTYLRDAETFASKAMDAFRDENPAGFFRPQGLGLPRPWPKEILVRQCNSLRQFLHAPGLRHALPSHRRIFMGTELLRSQKRLFGPGSQVPPRNRARPDRHSGE